MRKRTNFMRTICSSAAAIALAVVVSSTGTVSKAAEFAGTVPETTYETEAALEESINMADENEELYRKSTHYDYELVLPASDEYSLSDTRRFLVFVDDEDVSHNGVELEDGGSVSRYNYNDKVKLELDIADSYTLGSLYVFDSYGNESEVSYNEDTGRIAFSMPDSNAIVLKTRIIRHDDKSSGFIPDTATFIDSYF